jgi:hypothetical protein
MAAAGAWSDDVACARAVTPGFLAAWARALALAFLLLLESKPVSPAADGGSVKVGVSASCACCCGPNFWKVCGLRGMAAFGANGSAESGVTIWADAMPLPSASTQTAVITPTSGREAVFRARRECGTSGRIPLGTGREGARARAPARGRREVVNGR